MLANFHDYFVFFAFCQKYCQNEIGDCKQTFTNFSFLTKKTPQIEMGSIFHLTYSCPKNRQIEWGDKNKLSRFLLSDSLWGFIFQNIVS